MLVHALSYLVQEMGDGRKLLLQETDVPFPWLGRMTCAEFSGRRGSEPLSSPPISAALAKVYFYQTIL